MFCYVFCDDMKLIQDAIRLPLAWPHVPIIMGLWLVLLSEKLPSTTSTITLYSVWVGGGGVFSKNIKNSRRGLN